MYIFTSQNGNDSYVKLVYNNQDVMYAYEHAFDNVEVQEW
ncbi:hypothetical protein J2Z76_003067 [Sedimentibacter acidaminivorans]|uniref:Uncharacterized protein n=1 Tax=Sedimentibacter acidaminivorans TaxID=913099 RepID=A0ABS4GHL8_9FIRM|nr:hypothetical protein [Sedimentibacter acidaminivorans]